MAEIICAVYKITNTITCDFYIGSSNNVKRRWTKHKSKSTWKQCPNNLLYQDFQKYGIDKFVFEILAEFEIDRLKEAEQQFIETLKPTYNNYRAKGFDIERRKKYKKEYNKSDKCKEYNKSDKCKKYRKEYDNQQCFYNGKTITLGTLRQRFRKAGIAHPAIEAKKYLML